MSEKLKPCPFCGSNVIATLGESSASVIEGNYYKEYAAWCECCCCEARSKKMIEKKFKDCCAKEVYAELYEKARKRWNERAEVSNERD